MKVLIIATGEVLDLDAPYAVRLIEQRQAVLAGDVPVTPGETPLDIIQLYRDAKGLKAVSDTLRCTPAVLKQLLAYGKAGEAFSIGDEIIIPWTDGHGTIPAPVYDIPFVVVDIADAVDPDGNTHENAVWIMAKCSIPYLMPFSSPGRISVTETTAQEGWYYFEETSMGGTVYIHTALNLNIGDEIPTGITVKKYGVNMANALTKGYPRWSHSAVRQWLNSDAAKNAGWWTAQHNGDAQPAISLTSFNTYPGWLNGFSEEWAELFKPVQVKTTATSDADYVTDTTNDIFFLPSVTQMGGVPVNEDHPDEGDVCWPYWRVKAGLDVPSNSSNANRKIAKVSDTDSFNNVWLRSANNTKTAIVDADGGISTAYSNNGCWVAPATVLY